MFILFDISGNFVTDRLSGSALGAPDKLEASGKNPISLLSVWAKVLKQIMSFFQKDKLKRNQMFVMWGNHV